MTLALVTGGAGFIGSHLVRALRTRGDSVRVLDNFSTGRRENLQGVHGLDIREGDLRDVATVEDAVRSVDIIFHLAAFVSVPQSMTDPETCFAVNIGGTSSLFEQARRAGVRKIAIASSTAVYGDTEIFPTTEETPLLPLSPYAVSKQVTEIFARLYTQTFNLPIVPLRFFNVYGPRQRPDSHYAAAVPIFIRRVLDNRPITIYGDGKQTRDFIFVGDVVDALLRAVGSDAAGEPFNVCSGHETSINDLVEQLRGFAKYPPEVKYEAPRAGDIYRSFGSADKAAKAFGFQAQTSLADGLKQTLDWMSSGL
jgi:nucleoside-diphosphate-sugar epimerase